MFPAYVNPIGAGIVSSSSIFVVGATVVGGEDAICQEAPDEDAQDELKAMGKQLAAI